MTICFPSRERLIGVCARCTSQVFVHSNNPATPNAAHILLVCWCSTANNGPSRYHGHSWAKGLFESGDGKDQESTSEDAFASYALKMWGKISGDSSMDARGSLMLAIQARSFQHSFLMERDNQVQPPEFIGNKVTGILFENKIDHATYFGANIEYIEGIHMIPLSPVSALTRTRRFGK